MHRLYLQYAKCITTTNVWSPPKPSNGCTPCSFYCIIIAVMVRYHAR